MEAVSASEHPASRRKTTADLRSPWNTKRRLRISAISGLLSSFAHDALKPSRVHGRARVLTRISLLTSSSCSAPQQSDLDRYRSRAWRARRTCAGLCDALSLQALTRSGRSFPLQGSDALDRKRNR